MKHTRILPAMLRSATQVGLVLIALLGAAAAGSPSLRGATITVTTINDNGSGSLRQALADAVNGDTINFNSSLNGQTITLTSGELLLDKHITISGPGANRLAVDANQASRVFRIVSGRDVTLSGMTVTNGSAPLASPWGGTLYNDHGALRLINIT